MPSLYNIIIIIKKGFRNLCLNGSRVRVFVEKSSACLACMVAKHGRLRNRVIRATFRSLFEFIRQIPPPPLQVYC